MVTGAGEGCRLGEEEAEIRVCAQFGLCRGSMEQELL